MKLPEKLYKGLILGLLAIIAAYLLSPLVLHPRIEREVGFSRLLAEGSSMAEEINYLQVFIRRLILIFLALAVIKGCWVLKEKRGIFRKIKKLKDSHKHLSSLNEKVALPYDIKRPVRKKRKNIKKITRLSDKHAKKLIDSGTALKNI